MCDNKIIQIKALLLKILLISYSHSKDENLFQTNIGDQMSIGISDKGYKSVQLKCGSDSMLIEIVTEDDFDGILYTKGSFYDKTSSCFLDPVNKQNQKKFTIKFNFNECHTKKKGQIYSNVLVLQHDKELIMPGDAAFQLECDFNRAIDVTVNANLHEKALVSSRISLTDPDPAYKSTKNKNKRATIENFTNTVILTQNYLKQSKEEL